MIRRPPRSTRTDTLFPYPTLFRSREAMKVLATKGLVLLTPNRGCTVAKLTLADLDEAFPIMGALEALSGELACRYLTDDEIPRIQELHERMVRQYEAGALRDDFKLNGKLHQPILPADSNHTLPQ